jgi:hypothetical protein
LLKGVAAFRATPGLAGTLWSAIRYSQAQAQVDGMANDLLAKIPE